MSSAHAPGRPALDAVEGEMRREFDAHHGEAQILRLLGTFGALLAVQLLDGAAPHGAAGWRALIAGAAWTALRQWKRTAPQSLALGVLARARARADAPGDGESTR
jgi:hypothetical protein